MGRLLHSTIALLLGSLLAGCAPADVAADGPVPATVVTTGTFYAPFKVPEGVHVWDVRPLATLVADAGTASPELDAPLPAVAPGMVRFLVLGSGCRLGAAELNVVEGELRGDYRDPEIYCVRQEYWVTVLDVRRTDLEGVRWKHLRD